MGDRIPRVVIAPDSFKGTCDAVDVAAAMASGIRSVLGDSVSLVRCPLADGGEGTLDVLAASLGVEVRKVSVVDAIGRPRTARVGVSPDGNLGVIKAAEANGLPHVSDVALRPMLAHSFGVGMLARDLLDAGVSEILLCLGGSASSDAGTGFLSALGARFVDDAGDEVPRGAAGLGAIRAVDLTALHPRACDVQLRIAVDVSNPLHGPSGVASVFGAQKGATPAEVMAIDAGLAQLADVVAELRGADLSDVPGMSAAGGLVLCLVGFLRAELVPGSQLRRAVGFDRLCDDADLVITGEGSYDAQSFQGKVVDGVVAAVAGRCLVVVVAGHVALSGSGVASRWRHGSVVDRHRTRDAGRDDLSYARPRQGRRRSRRVLVRRIRRSDHRVDPPSTKPRPKEW